MRLETCRTELISSFPLPGLGLLRGREERLPDCLTGDDGGDGVGVGGMMYCMAILLVAT